MERERLDALRQCKSAAQPRGLDLPCSEQGLADVSNRAPKNASPKSFGAGWTIYKSSRLFTPSPAWHRPASHGHAGRSPQPASTAKPGNMYKHSKVMQDR